MMYKQLKLFLFGVEIKTSLTKAYYELAIRMSLDYATSLVSPFLFLMYFLSLFDILAYGDNSRMGFMYFKVIFLIWLMLY